MTHKAWKGIEEGPYCFQGHPSNSNATRDKIVLVVNQIARFRIVTPVLIQR